MWNLLLVDFEDHSDARYIPAMLKGVEFWLMISTTVVYDPHRPSLHPVEEGAMPASRTIPHKA